MRSLLQRINELSRMETMNGLSEMEKTEQAALRQQYLQQFRGSINSILMNVTIYDPNGVDVTPERLKREQGRFE
ncbi:DUF896 domain-containing protein [Paenibacillus sp. MWE-103]|uniref:UPF0291 protein I8J29_05685 n=1 Tax=Paenibacillus artemisiicola TaxID=1172618 RepID=A0ABS3W5V9_9BACL|nr:DUF896 domain-containing protein [Paenibacillus artemisiicola]MBO7743678.1 DUF896 domain-containing protein [Paenibacillus artemisiicola]